MNVGEFVEQREAVKEPLWLDKVLTLPSSLEYSHMRLRALACALARDFLVNVSKFVERREVMKEQLGVDKLLTSVNHQFLSQLYSFGQISTSDHD